MTKPTFRLITSRFLRDPYDTLADLRRDGGATPIITNGLRMWVLTRYDDARRVLADPRLNKDLVSVRDEIAHCLVRPEQHAKLPRVLRRSMFEQDGANHRRLRGLLAHAFTPRRAAELAPSIEHAADDLLDALPTDEVVDLVRAYTRPLATNVLSDIVGVPPGSRDGFPEWENSILAATSAEEATDAGRRMYEFCQEMVELKRRQPADDLFTELFTMQRDGTIDVDELIATVFLVLIGGAEPTSAAANGALTLLTHPEQLAKVIAEPDRWPTCVEEILRYETSFRILPPRHCPFPVDLDEITIPAHELIIVANSAANRDPSRFHEPDRFDIDRDPNDHLAFGHGPHRCMGAALGKTELAVGLRRLFERFPSARLAVPADQLQWRPATFLRRLESLPVVLARRT